MTVIDQRYGTEREIHVGDRVSYNGQRGRIVFVADQGEFAKGYEWAEYSSGIMIEFDNGARLYLESSDHRLALEEAHA